MSLFDDMFGRATDGEKDLRQRAGKAQEHAEGLEEKLLVFDPREATDQAVHSKICWDRQVAAQAWRRAGALQSQLNGAENRRYSRSTLCWMLIGFAFVMLKGTLPGDWLLGEIAKAFLAG